MHYTITHISQTNALLVTIVAPRRKRDACRMIDYWTATHSREYLALLESDNFFYFLISVADPISFIGGHDVCPVAATFSKSC